MYCNLVTLVIIWLCIYFFFVVACSLDSSLSFFIFVWAYHHFFIWLCTLFASCTCVCSRLNVSFFFSHYMCIVYVHIFIGTCLHACTECMFLSNCVCVSVFSQCCVWFVFLIHFWRMYCTSISFHCWAVFFLGNPL